MQDQPQQKPTGPRLPQAKDTLKLIQEGALALERGKLERAEQRLMAALEQLRQIDPVSWPMYQALGLLKDLRLAQGDSETAAEMEREQQSLAKRLEVRPIP
jgi:hypothetical protein